MYIPKLIFKYAYPFDQDRRALYAEKKLDNYPSIKVIRERVGSWKGKWEELNTDDRIMRKLGELTGVELRRDMEVHIFGTGFNPMSVPLMIPIQWKIGTPITDDQFTEMIVHEVCHRFVGDTEDTPRLERYWKMVYEKYEGESVTTKTHVVIYALLTVILTELFGADRIGDFLTVSAPGYVRAVEIVQEKGAEAIIEEFREFSKPL